MALPIVLARSLALRAIFASGRDRKGATVDFGKIKLKISWAERGRGLKRAERRRVAGARRASIQAANSVGKQVFAEVVQVMSAEAKASAAAIKRTLIRKAASRRAARHGIAYKIRVRPGRAGSIPVKDLKTKFNRAKPGSRKGTLSFRQIGGAEATFEGALRTGTGRGASYGLPRTRNLKARAIGGVRFRYRRTPAIERIRKKVKPRFKRAVLHQSPDKRGVPLPVKMVSQLTQTWHSQVRSFC